MEMPWYIAPCLDTYFYIGNWRTLESKSLQRGFTTHKAISPSFGLTWNEFQHLNVSYANAARMQDQPIQYSHSFPFTHSYARIHRSIQIQHILNKNKHSQTTCTCWAFLMVVDIYFVWNENMDVRWEYSIWYAMQASLSFYYLPHSTNWCLIWNTIGFSIGDETCVCLLAERLNSSYFHQWKPIQRRQCNSIGPRCFQSRSLNAADWIRITFVILFI